MTVAVVPQLSVVVPSVNGWNDLRGALDALKVAAREVPLEVIVPERCGDPVRVEISLRHPSVRILPVPEDTSIPRMRALAFAAATAPMVAVIEDHVLVASDWASRIVALRALGHRVIGGRVENAATERAVDWAAFLCEYHTALTSRPAGPSEWLTGNNTAYDRGALVQSRDVIDAGGWEDALHDAFRRDGVELWYDPSLVVRHRRTYRSAREYAVERFTYSRAWAALRTAGAGRAERLWIGARAVLLPPVLLFRIVTRSWSDVSCRAPLIRGLAYLPLFVAAWAIGEMAGAWLGDGGALVRVR